MDFTRLRLPLLYTAWAALGLVVVLSNVPYNPLSPSPRIQQTVRSFMPEGWAFFTRDPRAPQLFFFRRGSSGRLEGVDFRPFRLESAYGLAKKNRVVAELLSSATHKAPESAWVEAKGPYGLVPPRTLPVTGDVFRAEAPPLARAYCGELWVKRQAPVPWAYHVHPDRASIPCQWLHLELACP